MTQTYYPFDSGSGANVTEAQWSKMAQYWLNTGVIKGALNDLQVYADSTGLQVKVKSGRAWIQGHFFESDAEEVLAIASADATNPRIDRVIIRLDWTANTVQLAVLQGNPAVTPVAPALTQNVSRWEISLAQVRVNAVVSTIAAGNITDERFPGVITPTLLNGWVDNVSTEPSHYYKDANGTVFYYFYVKNGSTANNVVIANLPVGYRPPSNLGALRGYGDVGVDVLYHITTGGEIKFIRTFTLTTGNFIILQGSYKGAN